MPNHTENTSSYYKMQSYLNLLKLKLACLICEPQAGNHIQKLDTKFSGGIPDFEILVSNWDSAPKF